MGYINMKRFNKDKYLKKLKFKKYKRYLYIGIPCLLVLLIGIYFAYSKFSVFKDTEVVRTTVGDFIFGDIVITPYIDGEYSKTIPGKNDGYIVDKIVCDNDATASWDNDSWGIMVTNLTKRTKCNVYFKKYNPVDKVIAQLDTTGKCPTINSDGTVNVTKIEATDGYVCSASDAYGTSYYYRGNVTNNYVKFADKYWRIIRINGDGTVRVIYDGTSAHTNGESSTDRQIGTSAFNKYWKKDNVQEATNSEISDDNAGVGYMYGNRDAVAEPTESYLGTLITDRSTYYFAKEYTYDATTDKFTLKDPVAVYYFNITSDYVGYYTFASTSSDTSANYVYKIFGIENSGIAAIKWDYVRYGTSSKEVAQTNTNDSTIKTYLDNWYKTNISGTENEQYLADNIFCNDRSFSSSNTGTGAGMSKTYYNWHNWNASKTNLKCPQQNDAFTVSNTTNGNGALTYPIGLITTDETVLAGGWNADNKGYYLYSGSWYWTSSPVSFGRQERYNANVMSVVSNGNANSEQNVHCAYGVRPVLNLSPDVLQNGDGSMENPYHP